MAAHAKDALGGPCITEIFNLALAVSTAKAAGAKGLISGQDGQVLNLVATGAATVGAVVANEGAVAEEQQVGVGVEEGAAGVASEAVYMPSVASCEGVSIDGAHVVLLWSREGTSGQGRSVPNSKALPSSRTCGSVSLS